MALNSLRVLHWDCGHTRLYELSDLIGDKEKPYFLNSIDIESVPDCWGLVNDRGEKGFHHFYKIVSVNRDNAITVFPSGDSQPGKAFRLMNSFIKKMRGLP
ncbi:MAG: hypothetical protein M3Q24_01215 [bacterium]|nr:hypothetical protein [bacterium]